MEEDLINKLINLDNEAKHELKEIEEKEENIEYYINQKLTTEKAKIDNMYVFKKKNLQDSYDKKWEKEKQVLDEKKEQALSRLREKYNEEKENIITDILGEIMN